MSNRALQKNKTYDVFITPVGLSIEIQDFINIANALVRSGLVFEKVEYVPKGFVRKIRGLGHDYRKMVQPFKKRKTSWQKLQTKNNLANAVFIGKDAVVMLEQDIAMTMKYLKDIDTPTSNDLYVIFNSYNSQIKKWLEQ